MFIIVALIYFSVTGYFSGEDEKYITALNDALCGTGDFPRGATKIFDFLYLGGQAEATDLTFIQCNKITHVINCAADYIRLDADFYGTEHPIKYTEFYAEDLENYDMMQHIEEAYAAIEDARVNGGRVLIHCIAGVNRSGFLTVAYVMRHKRMDPIKAAVMIRKARGTLLTNEGFQQQLIEFARKENLLPNLDAKV